MGPGGSLHSYGPLLPDILKGTYNTVPILLAELPVLETFPSPIPYLHLYFFLSTDGGGEGGLGASGAQRGPLGLGITVCITVCTPQWPLEKQGLCCESERPSL